jgi:MFS family permease
MKSHTLEVTPRVRATILASSSLTVMAGAIVAPALPDIGRAFDGNIAHPNFAAKMVLALPALAIAVFAPVSGWFVDKFGCKPLLLTGLALYALAGTSGGYVSQPYPLLAGRLLLGVAVAMVMTTTSTLVSFYFSGPARGRFLGFQSTAMALGGVVFLPVGGVLAHVGGWHWPFAVYLVSLPILVAAARLLWEPARGPRLDPDGNLAAPTGEYPAVAPWPTLGLICGIAFVGMAAFYLGPPQIPFYVRDKFGVGPFVAALAVATMTAHAAVTSMLYGRLARHLATDRLVTALLTLMGAGLTVLGLAESPLVAYLGLVLTGLGGGLFTPTLMNWLMRVAPPHLRGRLSGAIISAMFAGQFLSPVLSAPLVARDGPAAAFRLGGVGMLVLGFAYFLGASWHRRPRRHARAGRTLPGAAMQGVAAS